MAAREGWPAAGSAAAEAEAAMRADAVGGMEVQRAAVAAAGSLAVRSTFHLAGLEASAGVADPLVAMARLEAAMAGGEAKVG